MGFHAFEISLQVIKALRPMLEKIGRRDKSLADLIDRRSSGVALVVTEGAKGTGRIRRTTGAWLQEAHRRPRLACSLPRRRASWMATSCPSPSCQAAILYRLRFPKPKP